jgi:hypothetical protein
LDMRQSSRRILIKNNAESPFSEEMGLFLSILMKKHVFSDII